MAGEQAIVAILAGGQGRRMGAGTAKATVALGARALICHPLAAARAAGLETVVVAKRGTALPPLQEQVLFEPDSPHHPLCGVVTALELAAARSPAPAVLVLACDMPFLTGALLAWLAGLEGTVMVQVGERPQPLLARWLPEHLHAMHEALDAERSLRAAISTLAPRIVDERELSRFGDPERLCFNVNDAEDLARAESWL